VSSVNVEAVELIRSGKAPVGLRVDGDVAFESERTTEALSLPEGLSVGRLDLSKWAGPIEFGRGLVAYELDLSNTSVASLPADLRVQCRLDLVGCENLVELPEGLTVGSLDLRNCTGLTALPEGLDVWFLDMSGCWSFDGWPKQAKIRGGNLRLSGCVALRSLPPGLTRLANLDVRHCSNLTSFPYGLQVTGWIDVAHSGVVGSGAPPWPRSLDGVALRWSGARIDRRIALEPHTITAEEVLGERNAEIRRAMLDRVGLSRFLAEVKADRLDADRDPGGPRELLRMKLEGDEDLVALSCRCPSTGRHYMIRVPPSTATCHTAAAWIAGFDNPDDYRPALET
jgi:hypothetical protein